MKNGGVFFKYFFMDTRSIPFCSGFYLEGTEIEMKL